MLDPESNPRGFAQYVETLSWDIAGGGESERECNGCPATERTRVQVHAPTGGHNYRPGEIAVIGRLINVGGYEERKYRLQRTGRYYFIAGQPDAQNRVPWRLFRVLGNNVEDTNVTGWYWKCHADMGDHPNWVRGRSAQFLNCDVRPRPDESPGGGEPLPIRATLGDDTWFTCDGTGCCNTSYTQLAW